MPDLTTLKAVKAWLGLANSDNDDALLSSLISQVSGVILSYLQRPDIFKRQWTDQFSGSGQTSKMLKNYPVIGVSGIAVCGQAVPTNGYWLDPDDGVPPGRMQMVNLHCQRFANNNMITYTAGYAVPGESHTAAATVAVDAPYGSWARDEGVTYASGAAMIKVAAAPAQGQYVVNAGQYVFAAADAGAAVLIGYSYVPSDLERACIDIVAERYKYKERIGQASKNISGEVISYSLADMPNFTKLSLQPFKRPPVPV